MTHGRGPESYFSVSRAEKMHARERNPNELCFVRAPINAFLIILLSFSYRSSSYERLRNLKTRFAWSRKSENERRRKRRRGGSNSGRKLLSSAIIKQRRNTRKQQQPAPRVVVRNCEEESPFRSFGLYPLMLEAASSRDIDIVGERDSIKNLSALGSDVKSRLARDSIVRRTPEARIEAPWYNYGVPFLAL